MAYAQHQQSYLAHHQTAMQLEQQMHQAVVGSQEAVSIHTTDSKSVDGTNDFFFDLFVSFYHMQSIYPFRSGFL